MNKVLCDYCAWQKRRRYCINPSSKYYLSDYLSTRRKGCEQFMENLKRPLTARDELERTILKFPDIDWLEYDVRKLSDYLIANGVTVQQWRDARTDPPNSGEHVLLCCTVKRPDGSAGSRYVCDGFYAAKFTETVFSDGDDIACEYSEADDEWYLLEGWYEVIKNWDNYSSIAIADFVVGWQPLPEPLKEE